MADGRHIENHSWVIMTQHDRCFCSYICLSHASRLEINKCIGDDTKAAARQSLNCIKNNKNKIWRKTILNMPAMWRDHEMWRDHDIDFAR